MARGKIKAILALVFILGAVMLFASPVGPRFFGTTGYEESIAVRQTLSSDALTIFASYPTFGVGLSNFYNAISHIQKGSQVLVSSYLQPAHNIYLLALSELGLVGLVALIGLLFSSLKKTLAKKFDLPFFSMLLCIIILGLFDHYFFTLQQGQLLFVFVVSSALAL